MDVIGVDVGGTHIRVGKIRNGEIINNSSCLVPSKEEDPNVIISLLIKTINEVFDNDILAIGIGIPSLVDKVKGIVYDVQNIPSWKEVYLRKILEEEFNVKVFLDNDANCFTLGEKIYGKGVGTRNFVGLTIGTGIGAGIINDGKLLITSNSGAGEFGMLPYKSSIYEDYCSGKFFKREYETSGEVLYEKAILNDPDALHIFKKFGIHMGNIIKAIMFTVDPDKIIIGGSIAKASELFKQQMLNEINDFPYRNAKKNIRIEFSEIKHPGMLGAAALCFSNEINLVEK
jgi:glucokinase